MTSINFNAAANSALRTLQATNSSLESTQSRISSGLKIGEAKDNAAYWSISTTLKSDNKALSTVKDALSLGASTVDVAYQGLNKVKDVLNEIKSKLVAASQDGVDKTAVQGEIKELQNQLKAIASASTFSGENWLSVDSGVAGYTPNKNVVSSFNRSTSGAVTIDTIKIDTSSFVLINGNTGVDGVLDAGKTGNTSVDGLGTWGGQAVTSAAQATVTLPSGSFAAADGTLVGKVVVSGVDYNFTVNTLAASSTRDSIEADILANAKNSLGQALNSVVTADPSTTVIGFKTIASGSAQSLSIVINTLSNGIAAGTTAGTAGVDASLTTTSAAIAGPLTLDANDTIAMSVTVDNVAKKFTITRAAVDAALGTAAAGTMGNANQYAAVITKAMEQAGITGITATGSGAATTDTVTLRAKGATTLVSDVAVASKGQSILNFTIIGADRAAITNLINAVNTATNSVTTAASTLGSVASRIELQKSFVNTLMDTIEKGVSGLIDADMSEESTKLQALQVKQSLGVQALSIANQSAQSVLQLFRS